ncbi:hypothetical protein IKN40_04895 [bacterium]|nr:hypothetical protein [bacterium]
MEKKEFTKLTLEQSGLKLTWEVPYEDVNYSDMMNAIKTIMVGMTFWEEQVYDAMANYLREYASDKYDVIEIVNNDDYDTPKVDIEDTSGITPHYYA